MTRVRVYVYTQSVRRILSDYHANASMEVRLTNAHQHQNALLDVAIGKISTMIAELIDNSPDKINKAKELGFFIKETKK